MLLEIRKERSGEGRMEDLRVVSQTLFQLSRRLQEEIGVKSSVNKIEAESHWCSQQQEWLKWLKL